MPWSTPTLAELRRLTRDFISGALPGADASVPNSVLRVMSDSNAALAHGNHLHLDWLARQVLVDSAEREWLERHAAIWVGGRKPASFASGSVTVTGLAGTVLPAASRLRTGGGVEIETTEGIIVGDAATEVPVRALAAGAGGNQAAGASLAFAVAVAGIDATAITVTLSGGVPEEDDESLLDRVLVRIRKPPHGGADHDYVAWAREVPGVSRAFAKQEAGLGTVTVRFLMDGIRPPHGIPNDADLEDVRRHIDELRPVSLRDLHVVAPIPQPLIFGVRLLHKDDAATRAAIEQSLRKLFGEGTNNLTPHAEPRIRPGGTFWRSWASEAISVAAGEERHELDFATEAMPSPGHLPVLGSVVYS